MARGQARRCRSDADALRLGKVNVYEFPHAGSEVDGGVASGGVAGYYRHVGSGGALVVSNGGETVSAIISSGGEFVVGSGGTDWAGWVSGGAEVVSSGGTTVADQITNGGLRTRPIRRRHPGRGDYSMER
jgi:autotransporter passenger strand-loop-strand repeat protein